MFYPEICKVHKLQLKRYHYLTLKYLSCNACMHLYFVVATKALASYELIKQTRIYYIILTSNHQRLRSAGDNDRRSKSLCFVY